LQYSTSSVLASAEYPADAMLDDVTATRSISTEVYNGEARRAATSPAGA
jgi:hypothetical protein